MNKRKDIGLEVVDGLDSITEDRCSDKEFP